MNSTTFDTLGYFEKLKAAGMPEEQAKIQAGAFRDFTAIQEENVRKELATKMDLIQVEMRLTEKIETSRHEILKWILGIFIAQAALVIAVMAFIK